MHRLHFAILVSVVAGCVAYVLNTGGALPEVVASHFNSAGVADGHMARGNYLTLMVSLLIVTPALVAFLPPFLARGGGIGLNIPNRAYWLEPCRREQTAEFLASHGCLLAGVLALFLTYVHFQVTRANGVQPATLAADAIWPALVLFLLLVAGWVVVLQRRFRRYAQHGAAGG